jgi:hypothetical protein
MTREFMMSNFITIVQKQPTIPIGILIEPLVKQLHVSQGKTYYPNLFDFEFFVALARHGKLMIRQAVMLLDLCAKIYINDLDWASACSVPFMIIVSRFLDSPAIREFIKQFIQIAFSELPDLQKRKK